MFDPSVEYVTIQKKREPKPRMYGFGWLFLFGGVGFVLGWVAESLRICF